MGGEIGQVASVPAGEQAERERLEREDVEEHTRLLRADPSWSDLRAQLAGHGVDPQGVLLAVFLETETCEQLGALVTPGRRVLAFERTLVPESLVGERRLVSLVDVTDASACDDADPMATALRAGTMLHAHLAVSKDRSEERDS